jgi:hypothetical protein
VVVDNLRAHKVVGVQQVLAARSVRLIYRPPYSPDLSPIELCWSKFKAYLCQVQACTPEALGIAIHKPRPPSQPRTPMDGSVIVAMPYSNAKTALYTRCNGRSLRSHG